MDSLGGRVGSCGPERWSALGAEGYIYELASLGRSLTPPGGASRGLAAGSQVSAGCGNPRRRDESRRGTRGRVRYNGLVMGSIRKYQRHALLMQISPHRVRLF
jgi:hypothetical protein